eukprot:464128_1
MKKICLFNAMVQNFDDPNVPNLPCIPADQTMIKLFSLYTNSKLFDADAGQTGRIDVNAMAKAITCVKTDLIQNGDDYDMFICALSTHGCGTGNGSTSLAFSDGDISLQSIVDSFRRNASGIGNYLKNKLQLFIVDACRNIASITTSNTNTKRGSNGVVTLHADENVCILYSNTEGNSSSWDSFGSYLIRSFVENFGSPKFQTMSDLIIGISKFVKEKTKGTQCVEVTWKGPINIRIPPLIKKAGNVFQTIIDAYDNNNSNASAMYEDITVSIDSSSICYSESPLPKQSLIEYTANRNDKIHTNTAKQIGQNVAQNVLEYEYEGDNIQLSEIKDDKHISYNGHNILQRQNGNFHRYHSPSKTSIACKSIPLIDTSQSYEGSYSDHSQQLKLNFVVPLYTNANGNKKRKLNEIEHSNSRPKRRKIMNKEILPMCIDKYKNKEKQFAFHKDPVMIYRKSSGNNGNNNYLYSCQRNTIEGSMDMD